MRKRVANKYKNITIEEAGAICDDHCNHCMFNCPLEYVDDKGKYHCYFGELLEKRNKK